MRKLMISLRRIGIKTISVALAVFLITAGIATYAGIWLHRTEKEVLIQQGKLNAKEAAMEYNRYLLTRVNIITLVGYTVDQLLTSGAGNEEVLNYITKETDYILATLDPESTGIYGWLGGEYLDGAGWVPDDGYVPMERPWYTQTMHSDRKITFVEPYVDMQTGNVMMTVSQLLSDGVSVIAMDVSLDPTQRIVEKISSSLEGEQAFVLDADGIVVAHPDVNELGKNYLNGQDGLAGAVARKILADGQMAFDLQTEEGNYSVYVDELEGGWYSVSLINADIWYRPLHRAMIAFAVILALVVLFIVLVFLRLNRKNQALQRLHTRIYQEERRGEKLQALSETDRMTGLKDRLSGQRLVDDVLSAGCEGMFLELDIDRFKTINDTYGHRTGDQVIIALADALRSTFRVNDVLVRLAATSSAYLPWASWTRTWPWASPSGSLNAWKPWTFRT